ncbi:FHA domain-containing protein, partial [Arthrospira platensis SPKY1]|nr:FHA domain-containing protein [Arthrospira platensis SPKY1]
MAHQEISFGRSRLNDLRIEDPQVSLFHGKLVFMDDGSLWIHDLDSTNGTWVNDQKIPGKSRLMPQDRVRLGTTRFDWQAAV